MDETLDPELELSIGDLPPDRWKAITDSGPLFASEAWLRAAAGRAAGPPHFFVRTSGGHPVAGLAGMLAANSDFDAAVNIHTLLLGEPPWTPLSEESITLREKVAETAPPAARWFPNLVMSLPSGHCITVGPQKDSKEVVDALVDDVVVWARGNGMTSISFLYVEKTEKALIDSLTRRGLIRFPVTVNCELELPGESFEDYLLTLSRNRRTSIRREIREVRDEGLTIRRRALDDALDDLVRLRLEQKKKYGRSQNEAKARQAFTGLLENFPSEKLFLFTAESGKEMVSFSLFIEGDKRWVALMTGTEYDDPRWKFVYFDLLFYSPIRHAYETGNRQIDFGAASWDAKRNRGCSFVTAWGFVKPLNQELEDAAAEAARVTELRYAES